MATKKDLVEAYQFSRRRLVTAFVSGAPGGREVEPPRPGRTIVGGVALAVLMIAGAAIAGVFAPRDPAEWRDVGLVLSKETGAAYVITEKSEDPLLRPVINITSAKLILGPGKEPRVLSQETIDGQDIGDAIGILGAPADLPSTDLLIDEGWTACTGAGLGTKVHVSEDPQVSYADGGAAVVRREGTGEYYLVAESGSTVSAEASRAHRYLLGDGADPLLNALGLQTVTDTATEVPEQWLALFPQGGDLSADSFRLGDTDSAAPRADGIPAGAQVGDLVSTDEHSYLLTPEGPVLLDSFALAVWRATRPGVTRAIADAPAAQAGPTHADARWPDGALRDVPGQVCAQLRPRDGDTPLVTLAETPEGEASAAGVADGAVARKVQSGRGAHVLSGSWEGGAAGSPFVVDAKATAHPLAGDDASTLLGYADHDVRVVPESWVELFADGVTLSQDAALRAPQERRAEAGR